MKKEEMEYLLRNGKISKFEYLELLRKKGGRVTKEESLSGNTPRVRDYCRRHGL